MTGRMNLRMAGTIVAVVFAWVALWRDLSVANVVSGVAIAVLMVATGLIQGNDTPLRLVPLAKFIALVVIDLVKSTWAVVYEVLTPTDYTKEAIIEVEVPPGTCDSFLLLTVAITVTPGTAVVEVDRDREVLYLHLLHLERRNEVEEHVLELAELALAMRGLSPEKAS